MARIARIGEGKTYDSRATPYNDVDTAPFIRVIRAIRGSSHFLEESSRMSGSRILAWIPVLLLTGGVHQAQPPSKPTSPEAPLDRPALKKFVTQHCIDC